MERMKRTNFNIEISVENVLRFLDVTKPSDLYDEILEELEELLPAAQEKIKPVALLNFGSLNEHSVTRNGKIITDVLYGICSIGKEMGKWSSQFFAEGDYLKGMLVDAISDDYLFQMDQQLEHTAIELCKKSGKGILGRVEAPKDVPMSVQKEAYLATNAHTEGIGIKESYMYDPVKTLCLVYLLDEKSTRFAAGHDCAHCDNFACKNRQENKVAVTVCTGNEERILQAKQSEFLLSVLQKHEIFLPAICSGRGTCGKCKVQVTKGADAPSAEERNYFSAEELENGWRLACCMRLSHDCVVSLKTDEENIYVVADTQKSPANHPVSNDSSYSVAVDIGTTTIAMQLVDTSHQLIADTYTAINRQRAFGADVISRIDASNCGKKKALKQSIQKSLLEGIQALTQNGSLSIEQITIAANTTMVHLLMGYSCETLGVYPFTPVNLDTIHTTAKELLSDEIPDCPVTILPGISTYVGGDIVSGLYALDFYKKDRVSILIDLGTNGEMAIGNKDRLLVSSTAAGPAFEGGNIVCGTGSIPGAICSVSIDDSLHAHVKTIAGKTPFGICGTGVIESTCELLNAELIDETGLLDEDYFETGFPLALEEKIYFYQKDIREIQLAKSAIRAGLETLRLKYNIPYEEIEHIYIAGGFGYKLNIQKAVKIGLFPEECKDKIIAVGNSSLNGAVKSLWTSDSQSTWTELIDHSAEVELSADKDFQEFYMEHMLFPSE